MYKLNEIPSIIDSIDKNKLDSSLSVCDRYYEHKYCMKINKITDKAHQRVSSHSNKLIMISIAENHPIFKEDKVIVKINCNVTEKVDRSKNITSGKGKRGAQKLSPSSVLCFVECSDGSIYTVYSCVRGKLLEINENLFQKPELIKKKPVSEGFIALILPNLKDLNQMKESLLSYEEYLQLRQ